jgi:drug/metabolite transporter (DMT)-like permease
LAWASSRLDPSIGLIYSLATVFLLTAIGVIAFDETLTRYEAIGIALGIVSILLLARFGE